MSKIYNNIKKNYFFQFIRGTSLSEAIWVLFLASRGMSLIEIGLMESIFHTTGMLMEIPTGFIADQYGRRISRVIGRLFAFISCVVMIASRDFWGFAIGFILNSLSYSLESGAGDALVYDSLVQCGREDEYMKVRGREEICFQSAHIISLVAGGAVATFSFELAYAITALIHLTALGISMSMEEPVISEKQKADSIFQHMNESLKAVWANRNVLPYIFHLEIFSVCFMTLYFYFQNFMKSKGYLEYQIGILLAATSVMGALMSLVSYRIEKWIGKRKVILLTGLLPGLMFLILALTSAEPVLMMLLSALEGFMFVIFGDYINKLIPSEYRATILSFEAMIYSVAMIAFFPIIGAVSENYSFKTSFSIIAGVSLATGCLTAAVLLKKDKEQI